MNLKGGLMTRIKLLFCLFFCCFAGTVSAFVSDNSAINQAVAIPYYDDQPAYLSNLTAISTANPVWSSFIKQHGNWAASVNSFTGHIHRAWGGSIHVGRPSGRDEAANLALSFLRSESDLLQININNLILVSSRHGGHHWFINFRQQYNGIDVFGSVVTVRISDNGNVVLFGADYLPNINISTSPSISIASAIMAASSGLLSSSISKTTEPNLIVFPVPNETGFVYKLGYTMEVSTNDPARWLTIIDANSGEILYRKNQIYFSTVDGFINGFIYPTTPFDSLISRPFEYEHLTVTGPGDLVTDTLGFFTGDISDSLRHRLTTSFSGDYIHTVNNQGSDASHIDSLAAGDTLRFAWINSNSRADERNAYYHANVVHDFFKALDPEFTDLDYSLTCNVNLNQTCNAYWDGSSVNFFMAGGGCSNTGEIADVIYHEYGHGITDYQYRPDSPSGAQHEGWSDYTAATITNQPLIGRGFYSGNPNGYLRTVDNTNHYPEDWTGESHNDGLIISGALWNLREALAPRISYCDSLFHFARYGLSGNYQDYLVDMIIYDDDDDNLFNLTPNWHAILDNFALHGIYPLDAINISHTPLDDMAEMPDSIAVTATITCTLTPYNPDSMFVYYKTSEAGAFIPVRLDSTGNTNEFSAMIPAQPAGTIIEYFISVKDISGRVVLSPSTAPHPTYFFVVGQLSDQFSDSLEHASGWTIGAPDDDATTGVWERVDPIGTYADSDPNYPYQPEDDHTPAPGIYCYITGQQPSGNPDNGANDVDGGVTSLTTPVYDMSGYENAIIEYFRWFTTSRNVDDTFLVQISGDGGTTWQPVELLTTTENYWKRSRFLVSQLLTQRNQVRLRFSAADRGTGSIVEGGIDDVTLYSIASTGIKHEIENGIPTVFALKGNYPNPFNGKTEIRFDLPAQSDVELTIFDIAGRIVFNHTYTKLAAGSQVINWDSKSSAGLELASGIYLYKIQTNDFIASQKMLLLK
jgi:Zn-dependent metalloprotease